MTFRRVLLALVVCIPLVLAGAWWWALHTNSGARFVWSRVHAAIGDRISVGGLEGDIATGLVVRNFRWDGSGVTVDVARFTAKIGLGYLPLAIRIDEGAAADVAIRIRRNPEPGPPRTLEERLLQLVLPFELDVRSLDVRELLVVPGEEARELRIRRTLLVGTWTERVSIERLEVEQENRTAILQGTLDLHDAGPLAAVLSLDAGPGLLPRVASIDATAELDGDLRGFGYSAHGQVVLDRFGGFAVAGNGRADFGALEVLQARAEGNAGAAAISGDIAWAGGFRTELEIELERFAMDLLTDAWPAQNPVSGRLDLGFSSPEIEIDNAALAIDGTEGAVRGSLVADLETGAVNADLDWQVLTWPIASPEPQLSSEQGQVRLTGTFDDWRANGTLAVSSPEFPGGRFTVEARGDRSRAEGRIVEGKVLGGTVRGSAAARWEPPRSFAANLDLENVQTGILFPEWPGTVTGNLVVTGQAEPLRFDAQLAGIRGRIRGWPLSADGRIALRDDGLSAESLLVRHGDSVLRLDGGMQARTGVSFSGKLTDVGTYIDGIRGDVDASGNLKSIDGQPALAAEIRSQQLAIGNRTLADSLLTIEATRGYQVLEFRSVLDDQLLEIAAEGVPDDPRSPTTWNGTLTGFSLEQQASAERREIHLIQSAPLEVTATSVKMERACLQGSIEASLCLAVDWEAESRLGIVAELDSIAVDRVNQFFATGFSFDQLVTGEMQWEKIAGLPLTASAAMTISPGKIRNETHEDAVVQTGEGTLTFAVRDGALLEGRMELPLPGTGRVEGVFSLADIGNIEQSRIDGSVDAEFEDIAPLRMFLPAVDRAGGRLKVNVLVEGTARAPLLTGDISLDDGAIEYGPLGLLVDDIQLDATFDERRHFDLVGEFRAGEGRGTVASSGEYGNGFAEDLVVTIKGDRLRLIEVPDLQATANTDLQVGFDEGVIRLDGKVLVSHARLAPRSLPATRYNESEDVVVIAGELPVEEQSPARGTIRIDGALEVGLGDDVIVDIDLAEAHVTGTAVFQWDRSLVPVANGRYDITGDVQAYGQVLTITEGAVRFPKVPANNPFLRIRAEREIFGNSQIKSAGILIAGTVKRPTVEPYTDPRTTRERALTLLVTGSDFDFEQGVGAIDFGTYIAPRLFVSYGIGLFDQENVISARYDLGKGFGVKATSGQKESGVDLMYHIER